MVQALAVILLGLAAQSRAGRENWCSLLVVKTLEITSNRREVMNRTRIEVVAFILAISLATLLLLSGTAAAQSAKAEGLITGRSGDTMKIRTGDSSSVAVVLTDTTQVAQVVGVAQPRDCGRAERGARARARRDPLHDRP